MLVAGFGGGVVVENVPPSIVEIDVMELEPKVIDANRLIADERGKNPLDDPRVNIIYNDARGALKLTNKSYDIIVSQPSHPWTAGASHLYTKEYMELVKARLSENGVFLQWMNTSFTDEYLLRALCKTLTDTYAEVRIYSYSPNELFFLASETPIEVEKTLLETGRPLSDAPEFYAHTHLNSLEAVMSGLFMETDQVRAFGELAEPITDNFNLFGTRSVLALENKSTLNYLTLMDIFTSNSPIFDPEYWAYKPEANISFSTLIDRLAILRSNTPVEKIYENLKLSNNPQLSYFQLQQLYASQDFESVDNFIAGQSNITEIPNTIFLYLINKQSQASFGGFDDRSKLLLDSLPASARAVINAYPQLKRSAFELSIAPQENEALKATKVNDVWFPAATLMASSIDISHALLERHEARADTSLETLNNVLNRSRLSFVPPLFVLEYRLSAALAGTVRDQIDRAQDAYIKHVLEVLEPYKSPKSLLSKVAYTRFSASLNGASAALLDYSNRQKALAAENDVEEFSPESITQSLEQIKELQDSLKTLDFIAIP